MTSPTPSWFPARITPGPPPNPLSAGLAPLPEAPPLLQDKPSPDASPPLLPADPCPDVDTPPEAPQDPSPHPASCPSRETPSDPTPLSRAAASLRAVVETTSLSPPAAEPTPASACATAGDGPFVPAAVGASAASAAPAAALASAQVTAGDGSFVPSAAARQPTAAAAAAALSAALPRVRSTAPKHASSACREISSGLARQGDLDSKQDQLCLRTKKISVPGHQIPGTKIDCLHLLGLLQLRPSSTRTPTHSLCCGVLPTQDYTREPGTSCKNYSVYTRFKWWQVVTSYCKKTLTWMQFGRRSSGRREYGAAASSVLSARSMAVMAGKLTSEAMARRRPSWRAMAICPKDADSVVKPLHSIQNPKNKS